MPGSKRPDPEGEAEEWFFYCLHQVLRRRDAAFAAPLAELGLDLARWRALSTVRRIHGCTMSELADFTMVDRTTLTRTVDQLAAGGLIERLASPGDRRRVCLALTEEGAATFDQALVAMRRFNAVALGDVVEAELLAMRTLAGKVLANITGSPERARAILEFTRQP